MHRLRSRGTRSGTVAAPQRARRVPARGDNHATTADPSVASGCPASLHRRPAGQRDGALPPGRGAPGHVGLWTAAVPAPRHGCTGACGGGAPPPDRGGGDLRVAADTARRRAPCAGGGWPRIEPGADDDAGRACGIREPFGAPPRTRPGTRGEAGALERRGVLRPGDPGRSRDLRAPPHPGWDLVDLGDRGVERPHSPSAGYAGAGCRRGVDLWTGLRGADRRAASRTVAGADHLARALCGAQHQRLWPRSAALPGPRDRPGRRDVRGALRRGLDARHLGPGDGAVPEVPGQRPCTAGCRVRRLAGAAGVPSTAGGGLGDSGLGDKSGPPCQARRAAWRSPRGVGESISSGLGSLQDERYGRRTEDRDIAGAHGRDPEGRGACDELDAGVAGAVAPGVRGERVRLGRTR